MQPTSLTPSALGRGVPLAGTVTTLILGLVVHATPSLPAADKLGDVLYAAFVVLLLWLLRPDNPLRGLVVTGAAWCLLVELLQLTSFPASAASRVPLSRLVLGSGFDVVDLLAYAVGVALAASVVAATRRRTARRGRPGG